MTSPNTILIRWYIDTRQLTETTNDLPLVETLQENDQTAVRRYLRLPDRHMSLASNLLKYLFIHRTCRIPWSEVVISRTPKPHQRPCYIPSRHLLPDGSPIPAVEFNVSHQASFVALGGCIVPADAENRKSTSDPKQEGQKDNYADLQISNQYQAAATQAAVYTEPKPSSAPIPSVPQVGIDITCVDEPARRRGRDQRSIKDVSDFIDIFKDVFSDRELDTMKGTLRISANKTLENVIKSTLRLFYAYWALKEAYIKMTGEALLAPWLRELEFTNVAAPDPVDSPFPSVVTESGAWSEPYTGVQTWLYGKRVDDVRIELVAFESDYLVATAARGANLGSVKANTFSTSVDKNEMNNVRGIGPHVDHDPWAALESIDIERDVRPCATGSCQCFL